MMKSQKTITRQKQITKVYFIKSFKWVIYAGFGMMFLSSGLDKFFHFMPSPELEGEVLKIVTALVTIKWLLPLIAITEISGGLLFLIPKTRVLASLILLPVMIGILLQNITYTPQALTIPIILFMIDLFILIDNRAKFKPLLHHN